MKNGTQNSAYFQFTLFADYERLRYLFFTLSLLIYMMIISANMVIIFTILLEKSLIYTYASCEFTILGIMAYDRFVAICQPLHYHSKMTIRKTLFLWGAAVVYPMFTLSYAITLTSELPICNDKLNRIFCANRAVVNNSCGDSTHGDILGYFVIFTTVFIPLFFVLYSYVRIFIECKRGSAELRGKALQTCLPHLVTFAIYSLSLFIEMSIAKYDTNQINPVISAILSLEYLLVPSINNPLIYGLKLPQIRTAIFHHFKIRTKIFFASV